ncbi:hypothetical protein C0J52_02549 [Blattella germanica]|nr:hypothetical protein C0J52_02549 [Blattella germanica]
MESDESSLTGVLTPPIITLLPPVIPLCSTLLVLAANVLIPTSSSGMLAESGSTDSRSPPEHSLPGDCEGITNANTWMSAVFTLSTWLPAPLILEVSDDRSIITFVLEASRKLREATWLKDKKSVFLPSLPISLVLKPELSTSILLVQTLSLMEEPAKERVGRMEEGEIAPFWEDVLESLEEGNLR